MSDKKAEKMAALALLISLANARELQRRDRFRRKIKDALWPFL